MSETFITTSESYNPHQLRSVIILNPLILSSSAFSILSTLELAGLESESVDLVGDESSTSTGLTGSLDVRSVTPPVEFNFRPGEGEEHQQPGEGDGDRERGGDDVVVLCPEWEIPLLQVKHREDRPRDGRENVRQVVRSPHDSSGDQRNGVDLTKPSLPREELHGVVDGDRNNETDGETDQELSVLSTLSEELVRSQSSPEDGS
jgi:hypothetical protein